MKTPIISHKESKLLGMTTREEIEGTGIKSLQEGTMRVILLTDSEGIGEMTKSHLLLR